MTIIIIGRGLFFNSRLIVFLVAALVVLLVGVVGGEAKAPSKLMTPIIFVPEADVNYDQAEIVGL